MQQKVVFNDLKLKIKFWLAMGLTTTHDRLLYNDDFGHDCLYLRLFNLFDHLRFWVSVEDIEILK